MAARATTTSARLAETIVPQPRFRIAALFAIRPGIVGLVEQAAAITELDDTAENEALFKRACDELWALDAQIMAGDATTIAELKMQAVVARDQCCNETVHWPTLNRLFDSIAKLGAGREALRG